MKISKPAAWAPLVGCMRECVRLATILRVTQLKLARVLSREKWSWVHSATQISHIEHLANNIEKLLHLERLCDSVNPLNRNYDTPMVESFGG